MHTDRICLGHINIDGSEDLYNMNWYIFTWWDRYISNKMHSAHHDGVVSWQIICWMALMKVL